MSEHSSYHLGVGEKGRNRRMILNTLANPSSAQFLLTHGLKPGMKVLDLGCGLGVMSCWIAEQVGSKGCVVAVDNSPEQLMIAREIADEEEITNITFKQVDANSMEMLDHDFDLVFCRYLLVHVVHPKSVIKKVFDLLKPGGVFVVQSAIFGGELCYPESIAFNRWREVRHDVFLKLRKDPRTGEKVYTMMHETGFENIRAQLFQPVLTGQKVREEMVINDLIEQEDALLKTGISTEEELVHLKEELQAIADDPTYFIAYHQSTQIVGIKP